MMKRIAVCLLLLASVITQAGTGYKCVDAQGNTSFQDRPCPSDTQSAEFRYRDGYANDAEPVRDTQPVDDPSARDAHVHNPSPPAERAPAPEFYVCTRPDGERYYSDDGASEPYAMPLGVLGYPPTGIDRAYGNRGRLGVSAPEVSRPPIAAPGPRSDLAASYVMVQDDCRRLAPDAACAALRGERDRLDGQLRRSFKDERAPLEARRRLLDGKLAGC